MRFCRELLVNVRIGTDSISKLLGAYCDENQEGQSIKIHLEGRQEQQLMNSILRRARPVSGPKLDGFLELSVFELSRLSLF